jgi:hypothetical protein
MHILSNKDIMQGLPPSLQTDERVKSGAFDLLRSIVHIRRFYCECIASGSIRPFFEEMNHQSNLYRAESSPVSEFKDTVLQAVVDVILAIETEK